MEHGEAANHVRVFGLSESNGQYVAIVPSFGRGVEDYTEVYGSTLTTRLVEAGYRVVLVQPRGIGRSSGELTPGNVTMRLLAHDLLASFDALGIDSVDLIGHAFGNRLARTFATFFPERVHRLVLLAAGGAFVLNEEQRRCLNDSFNLALDEDERLDALRRAFFARGNDPAVWLNGWYPDLARAQIHAVSKVDGESFKRAGGKPFLLIQASEDFIAPPDKAGRVLKSELGEQVIYAEIPFAGHALTPEQPEIVATLIVQYLGRP